MTVQSAQSVTVEFTTRRFDTGASTNADSTPTGTLIVNGTDNAASVTVTNVTTGRYKAAVTLPTLAYGDICELAISATVNSVSDKAIVWRDTKDVVVSATGVVRADNRDGDAIPTAAQIRDLDNTSPAANSLGAKINSILGIFSGITLLAQWLGLIAGKQTGNSTARSELRATGAGAGTFDETTDSLEALADVGGGLTQQNIDDIAAGSAARVVATLGGVAGSASTDEVRPGGRLPITRGDDYYAEDGFPISVVIENVENDLVVDSLTLYLYRAGVRVEESTTNITIAANVLTALVDMGRAKTSQLQAGDGRWSAQISLASGHYREPVTGPMLVTERVGPIP